MTIDRDKEDLNKALELLDKFSKFEGAYYFSDELEELGFEVRTFLKQFENDRTNNLR